MVSKGEFRENLFYRLLGSLIDDLLFIASSESGIPELNIETVSLCKMLSSICKNIEPIAKKDNIKIIMVCETDNWIDGDQHRLVQMFNILVDNAVKYSHFGGEVHIEITSRENDDANFAEVKIIDTGIGMTAEEQEQSSVRFFRGIRARGKHNQGMGLGIAIAMANIHAHGVDFQMDSGVGKGTTVLVSIPLNSQTLKNGIHKNLSDLRAVSH